MSHTYLNDDEARELARRWAESGVLGSDSARLRALDSLEWERLRGWVRRRMAREVLRREGECLAAEARSEEMVLGEAAMHAAESYDGLPPDDREALAHAVMVALALGDDPHGAHGSAWTLCERAGWTPTSTPDHPRKLGRMRRRAIRRARPWKPPAIWAWRRRHEPGWNMSFQRPRAGEP